jgi:hypothetical protein
MRGHVLVDHVERHQCVGRGGVARRERGLERLGDPRTPDSGPYITLLTCGGGVPSTGCRCRLQP